MTSLFLVLPLLLSAVPPDPAADYDPKVDPSASPPATAVSADGGTVPIVAPRLTADFAEIIAPELVSDGGQDNAGADGGLLPIIAPETLSVYVVDFPSEFAITTGAFALAFMVDVVVKPSLEGDLSCRFGTGTGRCNPATLSSFDRYAVGKNSTEWRQFSDFELYFTLAMPVLYLALESLVLPTKHPWGDFFNDVIVIAESMALTASLTTLFKFSFRRPRPSRYLPVDPTPTFDHELSLPSGHTAMVTAATTAFTTTVFLRHPKSQIRFLALGVGVALSVLAGIARVEGGSHFPTDVITGAAIGAFSGFMVPYLHRKQSPITPSVSYSPTNGGTTSFAISGHW